MPTERSLGKCPFCEAEIGAGMILIEYEDGIYAECPSCEEPVHPD